MLVKNIRFPTYNNKISPKPIIYTKKSSKLINMYNTTN
jgi:hypothetical protein